MGTMREPFNVNRAVRRLRMRHFELLANLGADTSLRAVAERMGLTQPAVSKALREIEETFGAVLFERRRSGVVATFAGSHMIAYARRLINELQSVGKDVESFATGMSGTLRIGTFTGLHMVPAAIARLRRQQPNLTIRVREERGAALVTALVEGEIDCIVGALPVELLDTVDRDFLSVETIATDQACVVASTRHPLAGSEGLHWRDLAGFAWALPRRDTWLTRAVERAHVSAGLVPPIAEVELASPSSLPELLLHDDTLLGVLRSAKAEEENRSGRVRIIAVTPEAPLPPVFFITLRVGNSHGAIVRALRSALVA
jgi:DNA-binding transcriptional LysR family regulator